jgi:hypothetical protein
VQIRFRGTGQVRSYLIAYRRDIMPDGRRASRRKGERGGEVWAVRSLSEVADPAGLDLRDREHAARLEQALLGVSLNAEPTAG